jgi:type IV pilus assembly protein PilM
MMMAAPPIGAWGIDLGQAGLKAVRLQMIDGAIVATAFDYVEHPKILSQPDADPDQLTREALTKFLSRNNMRGDLVCISVPGQSGLARFVKLPPVEEKKIADIVRFEAKQQIPFNLEEVVWDYQKIGAGTVSDGYALDTEIGLFAIKRDMVNRYLQHFKDLHVDVHVVQMAPLALCNYVAYDLLAKEPRKEGDEEATDSQCVIALDTGADSSNLVITDGERVIWQRPIPLGGNHFTRALTKDLKLTFAKAEHLKRNATKSPDLKKILASLKPVLNDFVGEVQRSLGYFTNTHKEANLGYMVGLGNAFRLPGLQRYLGEKLQLDVRRMVKMERIGGDSVISAPVFSENLATYPVAVGLALQGLELARLVTNLLPGEIRFERLVRAKKPWAVAGAAALMLGTSAVALSFALEYQAYGHPEVVKQVERSKGVVKRVSDADSAFASAKAAAFREEAAVKAIVAGQAEQLNWLDLMKFVTDAVPTPDHENIKDLLSARSYWEPEAGSRLDTSNHPNPKKALSGKDAYEEYQKHLAGLRTNAPGAQPAAEDLGRGIDDLIQFNIEAVDCRFCDDLPGFWKNVRDRFQERNINLEGFVRPADLARKPPEGRGWVVELRGYTFHHKRDRFVIDTLVENLARRAVGPTPAAGAPATGAPAVPGAASAGPATGVPAAVPGQPGSPAPKGPGGPGVAPAGGAAPSAPASPGAVVAAPAGKSLPRGAAPPATAIFVPKASPARPTLARPDPITNLISHVVLLNTITKPTSDTGSFEIIGGTTLPELVGPGSSNFSALVAAGAGTPGAAPAAKLGGGGGGGGGDWAPLLGTSGGTGTGNPTHATPAGGPRTAIHTDARLGGGRPPAGHAAGTAPAAAATTEGQHSRTEFIVLFVWKEPTPSDALRGDTGAATGTGGAKPGGPGGVPKAGGPSPGGPGAAPPPGVPK